jgi:hypothetical protein
VPLTTVTYQPSASPQLGSWSAVGAATAWQAVSDGSNATYVSLPGGICRLDSQVVRLGFPVPSLPAGAQVYSVGLRRTVQAIVPPPTPVVCYHWFRCASGSVLVGGQALEVSKTFFSSPLPTNPVAGQWVTVTDYTSTTGPDGKPWTTATGGNLASFFVEMGRGDIYSGANIYVSEVYLDVTYQQQSSVTVTAPTGSVSTTQPTITWTYSSADSLPQQSYQVAVYTQAQTSAPGFTPFVTTPIDGTGGYVIGGALQWTMNIDLTNGVYAAYVQVQSQWAGPGTFVSTIGSTTWTRSASGPPADAVLSSAAFDVQNNRVALTFAPGGASPATVSFTVYASRDGGQSWNPIPSLTYVPAQGMSAITRYDYVAALNIISQYYVIAYGGGPLQASSNPSNIVSVTPTGNQPWLKNPLNPLQNTVLPIAAPKRSEDGIKVTKRRMQGTFQLLGGAGSQVLPFIVSGPTYGNEYELELIFIAGDPNTPMTLWAPVDELDRTGGTLLFQLPDGTQLWVVTGPGASGQETQELYNSIAGDPTTTLFRRRKLTFTQVDPPAYF